MAEAGDPPQPPPRPPPVYSDSMGVNPYMGGFQSYGMGIGAPYSMGMYEPFNRFGTGMYGGTPETSFIRYAEESSRSAFQSVESVVAAVNSVANLLSSTHNAIFNSFRAVIGVVEQFRVLREKSTYAFRAFLHFLRMVWCRILIWLRLRPRNFANSDAVWYSIVGGELQSSGPSAPNWGTLLFWLVAIGGPYMLFRCVSQLVKSAEESKKWAVGEGEHYTAKALYDFQAANNQELSFSTGETLRVAPKTQQPRVREWLLASSEDGKRIGLVPINYIKLLNKSNATNNPSNKPNPTGNDVVNIVPHNRNGSDTVNGEPGEETIEKEKLNSLYRAAFNEALK